MSNETKYDENEFFVPRGTIETEYEVKGKKYPITVYVPDNFEHDKMMEEFTEYTEEESVIIKGAELVEERTLRFLKKAPFKCGKVEWHKAGEAAKRKAIRALDSTHRTAINKVILGKAELSKEESDFLPKE